MKVFFVRHGEAMDDVEGRFGGWADFDLSPKGVQGVEELAVRLERLGAKPELVLTSPFKRAAQTAAKIGEIFKIPVEPFIYLKERNTYGLLCGENKEEARQKYPELVAACENGKEVLGYEPYDSFLRRVKEMVGKLPIFGKKVLVCVTHGKLLAALFKDVLGREAKEFHDNCLAEIDIDEQGTLTLVSAEGIDLNNEN